MDTGLAVNGNAVESWNMSNDCTELISEAMFYDFIFYILTFIMLYCLTVLFYGIWETQKANFVYMHLL